MVIPLEPQIHSDCQSIRWENNNKLVQSIQKSLLILSHLFRGTFPFFSQYILEHIFPRNTKSQ